jgi:MoaA/NifB/PqqE/SkfB family radical SAM enzyme
MRLRDAVQYGVRFASNAMAGSSPRILYVEVTKRCNAFCDFCPYWKEKRRGELTDYAPIVERLKPFCVTFTGGEPLLRRDIVDLVKRVNAVEQRPYTALLTNAWLLSIEKARALREAGLEQVSISVDYVGEQHDRQRGLPGLYRRIDDRMAELRRIGFDRIVVNTVIMESNVDQILDVARAVRRWGALHSFSCYSTMKTDSRGELVRPERLDDLRRVIVEIRRLKRRWANIISSDFYLENAVRYFERGGRVGDRCEAAGKRFFHVDPWGYVKICPEFAPFAHWTELPEKRPEPHTCTSCWYGCRGENEAPITVERLRQLGVGASMARVAVSR